MNIMEAKLMVEDQILIENAILAFLHHYPNHHWAVDYADLLTRIRNEQPKRPTVQKRGRPAKRQRKKETASNTASTEAVKTT